MSAARQHGGQQDAADVSEQDRKAIRQGAARLGDGSRRAHRGGSGGNARQRSARAISGGNAQGPTEPVGEASDRETLAEGEGGRRGQIAGPGRRALCLHPERRSRRQGTRDAAAAVEMAVGPARQARRYEREARRDADETGRGALEGLLVERDFDQTLGTAREFSPSSRTGAKTPIRRVLNQYFRPKGLHY